MTILTFILSAIAIFLVISIAAAFVTGQFIRAGKGGCDPVDEIDEERG
jgi:hypothetical protein